MTAPGWLAFALPCRALLCAALALAATGGPAAAQSYDTGGIQLSFGLALRAEAEDNRALDTDSAGTTTDMQARLSFGLLSETRTERLALDLNGTLRALDTPGGVAPGGSTVTSPGLALAYDRNSAAARLGLSASLRESDLSQSYLDAVDPDSDELDFVTGTAIRRQTTVAARLDWGDDAPLGVGIFARLAGTTYRNGSASGLDGDALEDSRRRTLGASARLDLDDARQLALRLTWSDFDQDSLAAPRETVTLGSSLTRTLPRGDLTLSADLTGTEEGTRLNAAIGRSLDLPMGKLSGRIGATSSAGGDLYLSGRLGLTRDLARGALNLSLSRAVSSSDTDDSELLSTRASLGLSRDLTPLSRVRFDLTLVSARATATGNRTFGADLGTSYSRDLTDDWTMSTGYRHRLRDEDDIGTRHSNRIFLELRRVFVTRF